ncbi:MAG: type I toxin-antitoxin system SymE family toxin [Clostridiales bacterium]|nr:type I toxin-antitoxin system SymE family toxin [Clostridiales bacterium]
MKTKNIKVQYSNKYQSGGGFLPKIQMEGKWLEALGFSVGTRLVVEYEEGSIRIRPLSEEEENAIRERELQLEFERKLREIDDLRKQRNAEPLPMVAEPHVSYGSNRKSRKK